MKRLLFIFLPVAAISFSCKSDKENTPAEEITTASTKNEATGNLATQTLVDNLNYPWEILWGPDNFIWMTERLGRISRVNPQTGQVIPKYQIPDVVSTNRGC